MELRNGSLVGGSPGRLPPELRPAFEQGVRLVLHRWTALCLAVENEWGGRDSRQKADQLFQDILAWFYDHKEHYADDLEVDLEEIMVADFNCEVEDDSPREVSKELVSLHNELLTGRAAVISRLQAAGPAAVGASLGLPGNAGADDSGSSSSDDEEGDADMMDADGPPAALPLEQQQRPEPVVDADGFQLVQGRRRGRGR